MSLEQRLQRRVQASKLAAEEEQEEEEAAAITSENESINQEDDEVAGSSDQEDVPKLSEQGSEDGLEHSEDSRSTSPAPKAHDEKPSAFGDISFGALASAQASLGTSLKRKRSGAYSAEVASKKRHSRSPSPFHEAEERLNGKKLSKTTLSRASKHAPTEVSSKRAVSRKRAVVAVQARPQARDPRFSSLSGNLDEHAVRGNYSFLNDYRASEVSDLKARVRDEKDERRKEALRKQLKAMEDREKARERVEEERRVIREHRKGEKDAISQGKKPFFLKKGDVKRQVLQKKFEGMSEKKAERVMEKRRKKKASKERKNMPDTRRVEA